MNERQDARKRALLGSRTVPQLVSMMWNLRDSLHGTPERRVLLWIYDELESRIPELADTIERLMDEVDLSDYAEYVSAALDQLGITEGGD